MNQSLILKSGSDFKDFSFNHFEFVNDPNEKSQPEKNIFVLKNKFKITIQKVEVTKQFEPEP